MSLNISVTFRHTESTQALKDFTEQKLNQNLSKFIHSPFEARVVLDVQKRDHQAEIHVSGKGFEGTASATTENLYTSIDKAASNIASQMKKKKEKVLDRKS